MAFTQKEIKELEKIETDLYWMTRKQQDMLSKLKERIDVEGVEDVYDKLKDNMNDLLTACESIQELRQENKIIVA